MNKLVQVYVGIGSNDNPKKNIKLALGRLKQFFPNINVSPVYKSKAVEFAGNDFYNAVISFHTQLAIKEVHQTLHKIEADFDKNFASHRYQPCKLDLDLLLYGDIVFNENNIEIPRPDILRYAFVLKPLSDIAIKDTHPLLGKTYRQLWNEYSTNNKADIKKVDFEWDS